MTERFSPVQSTGFETQKNGCFTDVIMPNGHVRIIYSMHGRLTDPSYIPLLTNGVFLEETVVPKTICALNEILDGHSQFSKVKSFAQQSNLPLIFGDVNRKITLEAAHTASEVLNYLKIVSPLLVSGISSAPIPESILITSPLLLDSLAQYIPFVFKKSTEDSDLLAKVYRIASRAVPYRRPYVLRLRNALWATKIKWALDNGLGSHFTSIVGPAHVGLEDYLKKLSEEKEARILQNTSAIWPLFAELESYYTLRIFSQTKPQGPYDNIKEYEIPELKAIALSA
ncbi:MAG: hypothetical protein ABH812_03610 [bacterium]